MKLSTIKKINNIAEYSQTFEKVWARITPNLRKNCSAIELSEIITIVCTAFEEGKLSGRYEDIEGDLWDKEKEILIPVQDIEQLEKSIKTNISKCDI